MVEDCRGIVSVIIGARRVTGRALASDSLLGTPLTLPLRLSCYGASVRSSGSMSIGRQDVQNRHPWVLGIHKLVYPPTYSTFVTGVLRGEFWSTFAVPEAYMVHAAAQLSAKIKSPSAIALMTQRHGPCLLSSWVGGHRGLTRTPRS